MKKLDTYHYFLVHYCCTCVLCNSVLLNAKMLKETETEKTTGFNVTFLSLVAFHLPVGPTELGVGVCPPGYAYALALICKKTMLGSR